MPPALYIRACVGAGGQAAACQLLTERVDCMSDQHTWVGCPHDALSPQAVQRRAVLLLRGRKVPEGGGSAGSSTNARASTV